MEFHRHFTHMSIFCAQAYPTLATITTIVHLGDFLSYGPSAITYPPIPIQQLRFSSKLYQFFINFSIFTHVHAQSGYHHPPGAAIALHHRLAKHPTHLLAPVPLPAPFPIILSIFIDITSNPPVHPSVQHIHPPIHQLCLDSICLSDTSPSTSTCLGLEPTHPPVCPGSVPSAVHLSSPLGDFHIC